MELINAITGFLTKLLKWWFLVMPWEQAILVRRGKHSRLLGPGLYLQIPFIDIAYTQTTRMRMVDIPTQTISTKDKNTITIKAVVGYAISNMELLYKTLSHPEMTLNSMAMGYIGEFVRNNDTADITPINVQNFVNENIKAESYGLRNFTIKITTFAIVKTFRLIQDYSNMYEGLNMDPKK